MADPNIPVLANDIRFEDRSRCFVMIDPTRPAGTRDVACAWADERGNWRWRLTTGPQSGPYPTTHHHLNAIEDMTAAYRASDPEVAARLDEQRPRFSGGQPQIFRAAAKAA